MDGEKSFSTRLDGVSPAITPSGKGREYGRTEASSEEGLTLRTIRQIRLSRLRTSMPLADEVSSSPPFEKRRDIEYRLLSPCHAEPSTGEPRELVNKGS